MKTRLRHSCLFLVIAAVCGTASVRVSLAEMPIVDHLEPPDERFELAYRKLLARKLFVTAANYLRIVNLPTPASEGESAIAIYSRGDKSDDAFITYTKAAINVYAAALSDDPNVLTDPPINISRCDKSFPRSIATVINEVMRGILADTRPRKKGGSIILHATEIEFSIEGTASRSNRGLLTPYAKGRRGPLCGDSRYCYKPIAPTP